MNSSTLTYRLTLGLLFGFLVMLGLALIADLRQVGVHVITFRWVLFPIVLLLTLFNYLLRGVKFHYYLRLIGADKISFRQSLHLFVAGFPLAVTPGKVGEALKGIWVHNISGVSTALGISVVLAERISDGLAVLLLSTLGVIAYPQYWPAFVSILVLLLALIIVSQIRPLALALLDLGSRIPIIKRFIDPLREFYEGSFILFHPKATLIAVSLGIISWLGEGIGFYFILLGLGTPQRIETLSIAVFVLSFSTIVGAISTLPGGLGAAEASITGMLTLLLDLSVEIAATATLLIRFATLWFGVGLGLISWLRWPELLGFSKENQENIID